MENEGPIQEGAGQDPSTPNRGNIQGTEGKNNYVFNNCTVTINDNDCNRIVDMMRERNARKDDMNMLIVSTISKVAEAFTVASQAKPKAAAKAKPGPKKKARKRK